MKIRLATGELAEAISVILPDGTQIDATHGLPVSILNVDSGITLNVDDVNGVLNKGLANAAPADVTEGSTDALSMDLHRQLRVKDKDAGAALGAVADAAWASGSGSVVAILKAAVNAMLAATPAGEAHIGAVGGHDATVPATFTRPADTSTYASGDLIANNTVANQVAPMSFAISRAAGKGGMIRRARLRKTGTTITNASFRLHLYKVSPVQTGGAGAGTGDNAAWLTDNAANYVGSIDITCDKVFTDGASGNGVPNAGSEINFTSDTYYGLLEARAAYVPANAEQFTLELEVLQN